MAAQFRSPETQIPLSRMTTAGARNPHHARGRRSERASPVCSRTGRSRTAGSLRLCRPQVRFLAPQSDSLLTPIQSTTQLVNHGWQLITECDVLKGPMGKGEKRLERMRNNPAGDWQISDVEVVCRAYDIDLEPPRGGGSHYSVHHKDVGIQTIPARRPIKPRYIKEFVRFVDKVTGEDQ